MTKTKPYEQTVTFESIAASPFKIQSLMALDDNPLMVTNFAQQSSRSQYKTYLHMKQNLQAKMGGEAAMDFTSFVEGQYM